MSCITELLKLKGDKEVLLPPNDDSDDPWVAFEGGGHYKDYEYLIVLNINGHRCGYVAIPPHHPFDKIQIEHVKIEFQNYKHEYDKYNYDALNIDCHGGLTFMDRHHGLKDLLSQPCNDFWIGFDCGHCFDKSDVECMIKYYGQKHYDDRKRFLDAIGHYASEESIRDFDYVENECKKIIDQLIEREAA